MLSDITIGQFFPGNSPLHRTDPRMKLILTVFYIVTVFLANTLLSVCAVFLLSLSVAVIGRVPLKTVIRSLKPLRFIIFFTSLLNLFWTKGDDLLVSFWMLEIYAEGITRALFIIVRIVSLLIGSTVLISYTTSPIALTDGLEQLLSPLKKIKVPVHDFAMMMTIALRFIPTLIEETEKIMSAQKARGADFTTGSTVKRVKAIIPIIIPLFISAFRRAGELATAMTCRCYRGGKGRTKLNILKFGYRDAILIVAGIVFISGLLFLNTLNLGYSM